jgi:tetratricopeptide (TPR) repeat protein
MKAGLAAMELGDWSTAEQSLEKALLNIESVYAENENADKARSLWYEEGRKDFKGEPYERAMAYYYRGLLFLRRGDYENARASFKGGQLQDIMAEEKRYQDDFALLMFLEGWASQLNGDWDMANEAYALLKKHRPDFPLPKRGDNVLLIAETGLSPVKWATGPGRSELRFSRREGLPETSARFLLNNQFVPARQMEDVYWQATTRGGRKIDKILEGKVEFKESHGKRGEVMTQLGVAGFMISAQNESEAGMVASGIVGALGLLEQGLAASTRTSADARYWANLPDRVHVLTLQAPPQPFDVDARFFDDEGIEIGDLRKTAHVKFTGNHSGLGWVRSRSAQLN